MPDTINNSPERGGSNSTAWVLGLIVVVLLVLFLVFLLPTLGNDRDAAMEDDRAGETAAENAMIPPPVSTTIINSTSTINVGTTTDADDE